MDKKTYHVRLNESPAYLISTNSYVADRLEVSEGTGYENHGVYRRVSQPFIRSIRTERDKHSPDSVRHQRLDEIIRAAESAPVICDADLTNFPIPDLSHY